MRKFSTALSMMAVLLVTPTAAFAANPHGEEVLAPVERVFIPHGFDSNDNTEILVHGEFPNACYKAGKGDYIVNHELQEVSVWVTATKYDERFCPQVITPYLVAVELGSLEAGEYAVRVQNAPGIFADLYVDESTIESPDDYLYAPVEEATLEVDENGRQSVRLTGIYPIALIGCLEIQEVRAELGVDNKVLVVQPIMDFLQPDQCDDHKLEFNQVVGLDEPIVGKNLLHVRTTNGTSVNKLIQAE